MSVESDSGRTQSLWMATADLRQPAALNKDLAADVCVVGAGIAGLTTAYLLAGEGRSVVVLDDGPVGGGETGRTTAHLASALDDRFTVLEKLHGEKGVLLAAQSHAAAIDRIESIVEAEGIACDFARVDGFLFMPPGEPSDLLHREMEVARRCGLEVEMASRAPLAAFDTGPALRFGRQGQLQPLKYLAGLLKAAKARGAKVFTGAHVEEVAGGSGAHVRTSTGRTVEAKHLVVATNTPVNDRLVIHTKQAAYRSYVLALEVPPETLPKALFWDTEDPYHYVRLQPGTGKRGSKDMLVVGGEDHRTGQADDAEERWSRLESWTRARVPAAGEVRHRWSGQILEPADALAFIGRNPGDHDNVLIATGDSGHGMTHGTIAGMLLTDLVLGRPNDWTELYDPSRISVRAARDYVTELARSNAPFAKWLAPGEADSVEAVPRGEGAIVRRGLAPVAVYRSRDGEVIAVSAVCRHLGCIVQWNSSEKSWDCPCHGSRYAPDGHVLNGPARTGLSPVEEFDKQPR